MNKYITLYDLLFGEDAPYYEDLNLEESLEMSNEIHITVGVNQRTIIYDLLKKVYENGDVELFWNETRSKDDQRPQHINRLFCQYIYPRFKDEYIAFGKDNEEVNKNKSKWLRHFLNIIRRTYDEYVRLIDATDDLDLFNIVSTTSTSRFNDTPQVNSDGIIDTKYATNYTENTSSVDNDNAAKIAEVGNLIKDYYQKWSDEFKEVFIYE